MMRHSLLWAALGPLPAASLAAVVVLAAPLDRPYPLLTAHQFVTFARPHACIEGTVTLLNHEKDGDLHVRITDKTGFIVAEQVPTLTGVQGFPPQHVGEKVRACGIVRQDKEHGGWFELHPVERWEKP